MKTKKSNITKEDNEDQKLNDLMSKYNYKIN